jgi:hypothetical protein
MIVEALASNKIKLREAKASFIFYLDGYSIHSR